MGNIQFPDYPQNTETERWCLAPLYRRSPTSRPVLLTILQQAQQINISYVGNGHRLIIIIDCDLYDRAVRLEDYKTN